MHTQNVPAADLTTLLHAWRDGSGSAFGQLIDRVYAELKIIAARRLHQQGGLATLSPTELLHEALIGIIPTDMEFKNRLHFLPRCHWRFAPSWWITPAHVPPTNAAAI